VLAAGAIAYLLKGSRPDELLAAVRSAAEGTRRWTPGRRGPAPRGNLPAPDIREALAFSGTWDCFSLPGRWALHDHEGFCPHSGDKILHDHAGWPEFEAC